MGYFAANPSLTKEIAGQQVTGYGHEDANNYWQVIPTKALPETGRGRIVRNDDVIQLLHINTQTYLMTHDVASPTMPTNEEFTTSPKDDLSRYNDTLFHLRLNDGHPGEPWMSKSGHFRLIHVPTKVAMWTHAKQLPDWAFKQQEINGIKNVAEKSAIWYIDNIIDAEGQFEQAFFLHSFVAYRVIQDTTSRTVPAMPPPRNPRG